MYILLKKCIVFLARKLSFGDGTIESKVNNLVILEQTMSFQQQVNAMGTSYRHNLRYIELLRK